MTENTASGEFAELLEAARTARNHAYAPHSHYPVGAAVRTGDGRIFSGCNVENASHGLTSCAERNAVFAAVAAGAAIIRAVVVVTENGGSPCGACRQVLAEFAPKDPDKLKIFCANARGKIILETTIAELLPFAFQL